MAIFRFAGHVLDGDFGNVDAVADQQYVRRTSDFSDISVVRVVPECFPKVSMTVCQTDDAFAGFDDVFAGTDGLGAS